MTTQERAIKDIFDTTVVQSYEWSLRRLEAVEARIQHILTLTPTVMLAIALPTLAIAQDDQVEMNAYAIAALVALAVVTILGLGARAIGALRFPNPSEFDEPDFQMSPEEFQRDALSWSGEHLKGNVCIIRRKSLAADGMSLLLAVGAVLGIVWAFTALG